VGGAVYRTTAIIFLSRAAGMDLPSAAKMVSYGTGLLSIGTILAASPPHGWPNGSAAANARPLLSWHYGRDRHRLRLGVSTCRSARAADFHGDPVLLGLFGGNFAIFSLWLPELIGTEVRGTAFAFCA